jgi:two-component system, NtrC family, response regulator AtoC
MPFTILIVDDEQEMCLSLSEIFSARGLASLSTSDPRAVAGMLEKNAVDLVLLDIAMPQQNGIDLLKAIKSRDRSLPVIMITGYPSVESAVESMRYGALNFFVKPLKTRQLVEEIERIRSSRESARADAREASLVTGNPAMLRILREIDRVAATDAPVLVTGESGTGKELVAAAIHQRSGRMGPYVKVNCAAIPDTLLESEMFGHEQGAFTDAVRRRAGKLEMADGGTLFLDEIGDMTAAAQPKLLRVLQDGEFQRLGGGETLRSTARIIAATNTDVDALIAQKRLREDLFYRLSVVTIHMPALRERKDDLELLVGHFLRVFGGKYGREASSVSPAVKDILYRHAWPGNVRELRNCIERAVIFCDSREIGEEHLPAQYLKLRDDGFPDSLEAIYKKLAWQRIADALARTSGEKQKAARLLNISRKTLYNRMKRLGME